MVEYDTCRPADFPSFCVVDFADDRQHELVSGVLNQSGKHALENANYGNEYQHVTEAVTVRAGALHGATMVQQVRDFSILLCHASSCSSSHT